MPNSKPMTDKTIESQEQALVRPNTLVKPVTSTPERTREKAEADHIRDVTKMVATKEGWEEKINKIVIKRHLEGRGVEFDIKTGKHSIHKLLLKDILNLLKDAREEGAKEAYGVFLKIIKESKNKFPNKKEFEIVVDARDIEKSLAFLGQEKKNS